MKIPCIKCTSELWEYIKPHLIEWGYEIRTTSDWETYPLLCINDCGDIGMCNNYWLINRKDYNRELVTNIEEFLERAAKLKGYTYKRKNIMEIHGIEIKPGMVITTSNGTNYVAFPTKRGIAFVNNNKGGWIDEPKDIISIRDLVKNYWIKSGDILWEKPKEVVLTMQDIANKFGIPVGQLRIKE